MADQCVAIEEQGHLGDRTLAQVTGSATGAVAQIVDGFRVGRRVVTAEAGLVGDVAVLTPVALIAEAVLGADHIFPTSHLRALLIESAALRDRAVYLPREIINEQARVADGSRFQRGAREVEQATLSDAAMPMRAAFGSVQERGRVGDRIVFHPWMAVGAAARAGDGTVAEIVVLSGEISRAVEAFQFGAGFAAQVAEAAHGADAAQLFVAAAAEVAEYGFLDDEARLPGRGTGWTANTDTWAASRYTGFQIESLAAIGGALFGAGPDGLYAIDGQDDAGQPIAAYVLTGQHRAKGDGVRRGGYLYAPMVAAGPMQVRVLDTAAGEPAAHTYPFEDRKADGLATMRAKFGKGVRSLTWQFEVGNVDGAAFGIPSGMTWVIDPGSRRV
jgi:hypothetical protein